MDMGIADERRKFIVIVVAIACIAMVLCVAIVADSYEKTHVPATQPAK